MRLTRRGKAVAVLAVVTAVWVVTHLTADLCWVGDGYGSCTELRSHYPQQAATSTEGTQHEH